MSGVWTVCKRELGTLIATPIGPIFVVVFLLLSSGLTFTLGGFFERNRADLGSFFVFHPWLLLALAPAIGMRLWAEERRTGTGELLLTLPVRPWAVVAGKFLAAWLALGLALALTVPLWITVALLGEPDHGAIACAYLGSWLLGGGFLAVASACSASTRTQVVAFVLAALALLMLVLSGFDPVARALRDAMPASVAGALASVGAIPRHDAIARGVVEARDVLYFATMIGAGLWTTAALVRGMTLGPGARLRRAGLIVAVWGGFVAVNALVGPALRHARLDLTAGRVYTLSPAAIDIARAPDEPVRLTVYASRAGARQGLGERRRAVVDLAREFERVSAGQVVVRVVTPTPFSPEEDEAMGAGLVPLTAGDDAEAFFLGIVGTNAVGRTEALPQLAGTDERFLEAELARMILGLSRPTRPRVGVLSALPGFGFDAEGLPTDGQGDAARFGLAQVVDLVPIDPNADALPSGLDVVVAAHPRFVGEGLRRSIDAWAAGGGATLLALDPLCQNDLGPTEDVAEAMSIGRQSDLFDLARAWGVEATTSAVIGDPTLAEGVRMNVGGRPEEIRFLPWLGLGPARISRTDAATGQLSRVVIATGGALAARPGAGIRLEPLLTTTREAGTIAMDSIRFGGDARALLERHEAAGVELTLAARVRGTLRPAFEHEGLEAREANLVVIADADWIASAFWRVVPEGRTEAVITADNGDLLLNLVESLAGGSPLQAVRARARFSRPLTRLDAIRADAEQRFRAEESRLMDEIRSAQRRMSDLEGEAPRAGSVGFDAEQREELERFRETLLERRARLREVRLEMDRTLAGVRTRVALVNTLAVPISVALAAGLVALARGRVVRRGRVA